MPGYIEALALHTYPPPAPWEVIAIQFEVRRWADRQMRLEAGIIEDRPASTGWGLWQITPGSYR